MTELGLGGIGATLAARFLPLSLGTILTNALTDDRRPLAAELIPYMGDVVYRILPYGTFLSDTFPYGWDVEPDVQL